ncbi:IclR family transcriptional regulator [Xylophilus sp. GOD-11R]|uniref:IclR family transcriptional regulator n=1 Tax=Xylophilus sp. GOD-11R TaxID=3089814 RepID=UPI00298C597A|nr:helix-turn-helix domain-containing protein [Xylophilus sp. GOD-11R]WPB56882.1 helix-turn-helix domain-containing protein [Xylophilus sp. GOD-11R]
MPKRPAVPALADQNAAEGGIATLDRALSLLACFSAAQPVLTLAELAGRTRISKSTILRMLASLAHAHLAQRLPDGRWTVGAEVERLHRVFAASFSLEDVVMPALQALVDATHESAAYYVPHGQQRLCLYRIESPRPVRDNLKPGDLLPMDRGAGGRVLQAYADDASQLDEALRARIRKEQLVVLIGDRVPELAGLAAPVFGPDGALAGAVTLTMPSNRLDHDHAPPVQAAGRAITQGLGGRYPAPGH